MGLYVPAYMDFWRTRGKALALLGRLKPGVTVQQKTLTVPLRYKYVTTCATIAFDAHRAYRQALVQEWDRLDRAIEALQGSSPGGSRSAKRGGTRPMTAAEKKAHSERMKNS